jgi:hypothetical protein
MDLALFHPIMPDGTPRNFRMKDKFNGWTSPRAIHFLEWSGWYSNSISQRLLGHYRLFQHFKTDFAKNQRDLPAIQSYILQYRASHKLKQTMARWVALIYSMGTRGEYYSVAEVSMLNVMLIDGSSDILSEFLAAAEIDFEQPFHKALERIMDPAFFNKASQKLTPKEGAQGKEKGVFSKRQILIIFDLLSAPSKLEKINFDNPNKYEDIAIWLHAMTGKSKDSFVAELNDCRTRGLYDCQTPTEIDNMINSLTNISDISFKAGFRSIRAAADKKIIELESMKKRK